MVRPFLLNLLMMFSVGAIAFAALWTYTIMSKTTPEQKLATFQKEVRPKGGQIFRTILIGKPVVFLLLDCSVFVLDATGEEIKQNKVLSPGFYFGLDVCTDQSISTEGEYVKVYLANRAIGAGGGNTSGGYYRSKDGLTWEKQNGNTWSAQP